LKKPFTVKVPASSGNLGAGFDVLGLALNLHSELRVQVLNSSPGAPMIRVHGEGEFGLNTAAQAAAQAVWPF
jgi:homoserine kinase